MQAFGTVHVGQLRILNIQLTDVIGEIIEAICAFSKGEMNERHLFLLCRSFKCRDL